MKRSYIYLGDAVDWRSWAVFRRNGTVYFRNWRTAFVPPAMEPIIFFLAFGVGLGAYVGSMTVGESDVSYGSYVAPGLLAYTAFSSCYFESLYGSYVRMYYQKTWDGILATQVELHHIVWGEALWAGARGALNTAVVSLVLAGFHVGGYIEIAWWLLPAAPLLAFGFGWAVASFALIFTALVPSIDHMNYPVFLIGIPLGLVSNTYFPVDGLNPVIDVIIQANPVFHLAEVFRSSLLGGVPDWGNVLGLFASCGVILLVCMAAAQRLTRRRVLGE